MCCDIKEYYYYKNGLNQVIFVSFLINNDIFFFFLLFPLSWLRNTVQTAIQSSLWLYSVHSTYASVDLSVYLNVGHSVHPVSTLIKVSRLGLCSPVVARETGCGARYLSSWGEVLIPTRSNRIRSTVSMIRPLTTVLSFFPVCYMEKYFRKKNQMMKTGFWIQVSQKPHPGNIVMLCCSALRGVAFLPSCLFFLFSSCCLWDTQHV